MERKAPLFGFHGLSMFGVSYAPDSNIGQAKEQLHGTGYGGVDDVMDGLADFLESYVAISTWSIAL